MITIRKRGKAQTIQKSIRMEGPSPFIKDHKTSLVIKPYTKGIVFEIPGEGDERIRIPLVLGCTKNSNGRHTTWLGGDNGWVETVEHLLSALTGMGIDSCFIELHGSNQIPVPDGSAEAFCEEIDKAGIKLIDRPKKVVTVDEDIFFHNDKGSLAILRPADKTTFSALIQFPKPIGEQYLSVDLDDYWEEIKWARTFIRRSCDDECWERCREELPCLAEDILDSNVLVFRDGEWLMDVNDKEPVRHKILDAIGDLTLLGYPLVGNITLIRPGHEFNRSLVNYLVKNL